MIKDICSDLLEYENFLEFYLSGQYQTLNMSEKAKMRLAEIKSD